MNKVFSCAVAAGLVSTAGCAPMDARPTPREQQQFAAAIGDRIPGPRQSCIPQFRMGERIDAGDRLVFRDGATLFVADTAGGCQGVGDHSNALVIDYHGGTSLCAGNPIKLVDIETRTLRGVCTVQGFTPYRPR